MWTINSHDVFRLRTPGGDHFTKFVDALIIGEAYIQGVQLSQIATNQRTNLGDGGVDTEGEHLTFVMSTNTQTQN